MQMQMCLTCNDAELEATNKLLANIIAYNGTGVEEPKYFQVRHGDPVHPFVFGKDPDGITMLPDMSHLCLPKRFEVSNAARCTTVH